jgi:hypothetical protein
MESKNMAQNPVNQPTGTPAPQPATARPSGPVSQQPVAAQAAAAEDDYNEEEEEGEGGYGGNTFLMFTAVPSWLVSMMFHIVVLLMAAFLTFAVNDDAFRNVVVVKEVEEPEEIEEFEEEEMEQIDVESDIVADVMP